MIGGLVSIGGIGVRDFGGVIGVGGRAGSGDRRWLVLVLVTGGGGGGIVGGGVVVGCCCCCCW